MSSINQLVSEIANSLGEPNNFALRENIRSIVLHEYVESVRRSYENHHFTDSNLQQKFVVDLEDVKDGSYHYKHSDAAAYLPLIKRTVNRVPRPVRLTNNVPFTSVVTRGYVNPVTLAFARESRGRFYKNVPGLCGVGAYDYVNGRIYVLLPSTGGLLAAIDKIAIEAAWENIYEIDKIIRDGDPDYDDFDCDNEYFISEDIIGNMKERLLSRNFFEIKRETNEIPLNTRTV